MVVEWLPLVFTAGWASGVNAYAVVLLLGLLGRLTPLGGIPELLTSPTVLIAAGALFLVEVVADKIPYVDSGWDAVHTFIRPAVGGGLGLMLTGDADTWQQALGLSMGGALAFASHLAKSGIRLAVNTSPEPMSNVVVSGAEDLAVAGVLATALLSPWLAAALAAVLLVLAGILGFLAWRSVRRGWRMWRGRRVPVTPPGLPPSGAPG